MLGFRFWIVIHSPTAWWFGTAGEGPSSLPMTPVKSGTGRSKEQRGQKPEKVGITSQWMAPYMWEIIIELRKDRVPEVLRQNGVVHILR